MFHPPLQLWNMTPACWYEEWIPAFKTKSPRKLLCISYSEHKTNHWEQSKINFLVDPQDPLLAFVKRWRFARFRHFICHDSLSFRAPWRVGNAMVGRGNAGWTTSNSGHPCSCQKCSQGPLALDLCWIVSHVPQKTQSVKGLIWTEMSQRSMNKLLDLILCEL